MVRHKMGYRPDRVEIVGMFALVLGSLLLFGGSFRHNSYRGDGTFVNNPGGRYGNGSESRYEVNFGRVDLSDPKSRTFSFTGMPQEEFIIGLRVSPEKNRLPHEYLLNPVVRVLVERQGAVVIDQTARLGEWSWERSGRVEEGVGPSFLYRSGKSVEIPLEKRGSVRIERTGEAADHGWGTNFRPLSRNAYRLTFEVVAGDPVANKFRVELVMRNM